MTADAKPSESDDRSILAGGHLLLMTSAGPFDVPGFIGNNQRYDDLIGASSEIQTSMGSLRLLNLEELIEQKNAWIEPRTARPSICSKRSCNIADNHNETVSIPALK